MIPLVKLRGNERRMSLRPPRAVPIDFLNEIKRKSTENEPEASTGVPTDILNEIKRKSKEN